MFGNIINSRIENNKVIINFKSGKGIVEIISPWVLNIFSPLKYDNHYSRTIEDLKIENCEFSMEEKRDHINIKTSEISIKIYDNFKVDFYDKYGKIICKDYRGSREPFVRRGTSNILEEEGHKIEKSTSKHRIEIIKEFLGDEKFYGLGETTGHLNKKGYSYEMWNSDNPSPHAECFKSLYKSIPFFITLREELTFGIFFDNTFKSCFDMGKENSKYYYFGADDGNLDYYFILGSEIKDVLKRYSDLTGHTPLPQMWTLGYQQCRWSYTPEIRIMEVAKDMRKYDLPCDVLYLDIDYMDGYRVFTWDKEKFPNPKKLTDNLKKDGFKLVTIIDPGVKKDRGYVIYEQGLKNNYYALDKDGLPYANVVWPGDSVYPDFSDSKVRKWWAENQKIMIDTGVSGIWNDMNEPASFRGSLPDNVQFKNDNRPTNHTEIHNVYGHLMSKATYEGIKKYTNKRPFVITRACYAGIQKYSTVWTGDNQSLWEHLRMSVPMLLNLGLSGVAFCGTDVGGFGFDCTSELLSRWVQVGCFTPLFRNHSSMYTRDQEPWTFDEETLNINRKYIKLRYTLLPYLYNLMWLCEKNGMPVMRPLLLHYIKDRNTYEINDEFLYGENILVAPVLEQGKKFRSIYLPEGKWVDYWTKEIIEGGKVIIKDTPLEICPMYIRYGSIIPNYPEQKYVGERIIDELILDVYPGKCEYIHYQDDGESFNYKDGEYNLYKFDMALNSNLEIQISILKLAYKEIYKTFKIMLNINEIKTIYFEGKKIDYKKISYGVEFIIPAEEGTVFVEIV